LDGAPVDERVGHPIAIHEGPALTA
jgi:hypothetical protein